MAQHSPSGAGNGAASIEPATPSAFERLWQRRNEIFSELFAAEDAAEAERAKAHQAAQAVQAAYRGHVERQRLRAQHQAASAIQRSLRAASSRQRADSERAAAAAAKEQALYNAAATQIQRMFRGFWSRRYVHDCRRRREYLAKIAAKGAETRAELAAHRAALADAARLAEQAHVKDSFARAAARSHHLVGTTHVPGVFNSPFYDPPIAPGGDTVEDALREALRRELRSGAFPSTHDARTLAARRAAHEPSPEPLPAAVVAAASVESYGPFKPRSAVLAQRARPTVRTLRREAPYSVLDERLREEARAAKLQRVAERDFVATVRPAPARAPQSVHAADLFRPRPSLGRADERAQGHARFRTSGRPPPLFDVDGGAPYTNLSC